MSLRAVLFDVGNTLTHLDYGFLCEVLADLGGPDVDPDRFGRADAKVRLQGIPRDDRKADLSLPAQQRFFRRYMGAVADRLSAGTLGAELGDSAYREHRNRELGLWSCMDPDAPLVLRTLADLGLRLGVVSNADGRVRTQLKLLGLLPWFDPVVDSHEVGVAKPDPTIFRVALDRLGIAPAEALYVGDMVDTDVVGARRAGLSAVLYDRFDVMPRTPALWKIRRLGELGSAVGRTLLETGPGDGPAGI